MLMPVLVVLNFAHGQSIKKKTYGTAIEGINLIVDVKSERIFCIQGTYSFNERLTKVPVYTPVPLLICLARVFLGTA